MTTFSEMMNALRSPERKDKALADAAMAVNGGLLHGKERVVIAYHIGRDVVCPDPECLFHYADSMATAAPLTQAGIEQIQEEREGQFVSCDSCMEPLS